MHSIRRRNGNKSTTEKAEQKSESQTASCAPTGAIAILCSIFKITFLFYIYNIYILYGDDHARMALSDLLLFLLLLSLLWFQVLAEKAGNKCEDSGEIKMDEVDIIQGLVCVPMPDHFFFFFLGGGGIVRLCCCVLLVCRCVLVQCIRYYIPFKNIITRLEAKTRQTFHFLLLRNITCIMRLFSVLLWYCHCPKAYQFPH